MYILQVHGATRMMGVKYLDITIKYCSFKTKLLLIKL